MKKKKFILFPLLTLLLSSCLFDTDDEGLSSWLSDQGMPSSYKVQTVTVNNLKPVSAKAYSDTLTKNGWSRGVFGAASGMSYDIVYDFALDSANVETIKSADSAKSFLLVYLVDLFYQSKLMPDGVLPFEEDLDLKVSWTLSDAMSESECYNLKSITDSVWFHELDSWKPKKSANTTFSVTVADTSSMLTIEMPNALVEDIRKHPGYRRLQLRISAPEASHVYRIYGPSHEKYYPVFRMVPFEKDSDGEVGYRYEPMRVAVLYSNHQACSECLVLHGGTYDSLIVELPAKPILKALSDFYGDEFPYTVGDKNDVRQAVVMAQVTFFRDDAGGESELGLPIEVQVSTYLDSAEAVVRRSEDYKLDKERIYNSGHPNVVFYDGDSLTLQVTNGMREFVNKASDGRNFRMLMRLGNSILGIRDSSHYYDYVTADDTVHVFFPNNIEYSRYDFTSIKSKAASLKLWLASKRGEE